MPSRISTVKDLIKVLEEYSSDLNVKEKWQINDSYKLSVVYTIKGMDHEVDASLFIRLFDDEIEKFRKDTQCVHLLFDDSDYLISGEKFFSGEHESVTSCEVGCSVEEFIKKLRAKK